MTASAKADLGGVPPPPAYVRVDWRRIASGAAGSAGPSARAEATRIRWAIIPLSILLCVLQAAITILAENIQRVTATSTLISVIAFVVLVALAAGVNPLLRMERRKLAGLAAAWLVLGVPVWIFRVHDGAATWRVVSGVWVIGSVTLAPVLALRLSGARPMSRAELMSIFTAMLVTAGVSTFGLTSQLIPLLPAPYNPQWSTPQRGWNTALHPHLRTELYVQDRAAVETFYRGVSRDRDGNRMVVPNDDAPWRDRVTYFGRVFRSIPWATWISPLSYWLVLVAGVYGLFYSLTYVVLPYWRDREKLIFPLAKLPESLLPDEDSPAGSVPSMFRSNAFWIGFALSAGVLLWNGLAINGAVDSSLRIVLGMSRQAVDSAIQGTLWEGLGSSGALPLTFIIIFTAIGVAFLLPLEISSSMWGYFLVGKAIILIAVWMGYGRVAGDFPTDWLWFNNPVTAQGGGALFFFSALSLWRCLKDYFQLIRGKPLAEALRVGMPVVGLAISLVIVTGWLRWNSLGWFWAAAITLSLTLLTVGLMRIVAEGGVYWFQSHTSFFHLYKTFGLGKFLPAPLLAPLIPVYSVLFLDIKTFMAPNLLNAAEMQSDVGGNRLKFHLNIGLCLVATVVLSLGLALFLAHLWGGNSMHGWFYIAGPSNMLDTARDATREVARVNTVNAVWTGVGAAWVALSMYLRTWLFWFPHPIGYVMLMNPLMSRLWFSFFIGWACKKVVVQYGGKATFDKVRGAFIGLIVGELIMIAVWMTMNLLNPAIRSTGIDLNRQLP